VLCICLHLPLFDKKLYLHCFRIVAIYKYKMKDQKGRLRGKCKKQHCDCDDYQVEKNFHLCAYCGHVPVAHGINFWPTKGLILVSYKHKVVFCGKCANMVKFYF